MRDFVYRTRADYLPKQYLNFTGKRSMLEHTFDRAETLIPARRLFVVIAKEHLQFDEVRRQVAARPRECVVIQPENKDTGPGLLLPLLFVYKQYPKAAVAVYPSDHFILEEDRFMQHVDRAFRVVESDGSRIVLLGMEPHEPDSGYGYIVPGEQNDDTRVDACRKVELFIEKPSAEAAKKIIQRGALWNTLVIVCRCRTLLEAIQRATPELCRSFEPIQNAIRTADEQRVIEQVYHKLPSLDFSKGVLEVLPFALRQALVVLPVSGVTWSDWGTDDRVSNTLRQLSESGYAQPEQLLMEGKT
ncbi:MAG: hypothetical protein HY695_16555 [Deltaproteobacteria bacterium]|nr:hypothetical protein [Deltaproteobacteria bacterium]